MSNVAFLAEGVLGPHLSTFVLMPIWVCSLKNIYRAIIFYAKLLFYNFVFIRSRRKNVNKITLRFDLDLDFRLMAITCPMSDYRLAYYINHHLNLKFARAAMDEEHRVVLEKRGATLVFSKYRYHDKELDIEYYLLANKGHGGGYLIPEMKAMDFFFMVKKAYDEELLQCQFDAIKSIPNILVATEIDPHKLRSNENLLF